MKINLKEYQKRVLSKLIKCNKHPTEELYQWSYTNACQHGWKWDQYTREARGIITDKEGNILYRPFQKFFELNHEEETELENLPKCNYTVYEKVDCSLGILYFKGDLPQIATKGSFISEQAKKGTLMLLNKELKRSDFLPNHTYLFEIIYPENRIVINYGDRKELVLLAVLNTKTGKSIDFISEAKRLGFSTPKIYKIDISNATNQKLLDEMSGNEEGYVIHFDNELRVKVKGSEYKRLHRVINTMSNDKIILEYIYKLIFEKLDHDEFINSLPENIKEDVDNKIMFHLNNLRVLRYDLSMALHKTGSIKERKDKAKYILDNYKKISGLIFSALDRTWNDKVVFNYYVKMYNKGGL